MSIPDSVNLQSRLLLFFYSTDSNNVNLESDWLQLYQRLQQQVCKYLIDTTGIALYFQSKKGDDLKLSHTFSCS